MKIPAVAHKAANGQILAASGVFAGGAVPSDSIIAIHSGDMPAAIAGKLTLPAINPRIARLATILLSKEMARFRRIPAISHGGRRQRNRRIEKLTALLHSNFGIDDHRLQVGRTRVR